MSYPGSMEMRSLDTPGAVADAVRDGRRAMHLTQVQLAERAGVGRKFVVELEAGHPRAELSKVLDVLRALDIQPMAASEPAPALSERRPSYADRKPYAIADDLDSLAGPVAGIVELPVTLDWSPKKRYDVTDVDDRHRLYETVLSEALKPGDLQTYLNKEFLIEAWPHLLVPRRVKGLWESAFPELASRSGVVGVRV